MKEDELFERDIKRAFMKLELQELDKKMEAEEQPIDDGPYIDPSEDYDPDDCTPSPEDLWMEHGLNESPYADIEIPLGDEDDELGGEG